MLKENASVSLSAKLMEPAMNLVKLYVAQSIFTFSYIYLLGVMGENIAATLKNRLFESIIKQDIAFYDQTRSGELIDRLTTDIQDFKVDRNTILIKFNKLKVGYYFSFQELF